MRTFRAYFDGNSGIDDYVYIEAENMTEAKRKAQEYKRGWKIQERVRMVVEVPTITTFGRYGRGIYVRMEHGGTSTSKEFRMDATVQDIYDYTQKLIEIQDGYVDKEAIGW